MEARIQPMRLQEARLHPMEAGSHLKPYQSISCSILQLLEPFGNRLETVWRPESSPGKPGSQLKPYQSVSCSILEPFGNRLETVWRTESSPGGSRRPDFAPWKQVLTSHPISQSVVRFYNCLNRLETVWKPFGGQNPAQEAQGGQTSHLEAGSRLKPYQSVSQLFDFTIV